MGLYIDPEGDKLAFLTEANAKRITFVAAMADDLKGDSLPCAYVDNGDFDAIAIGYSKEEVYRFAYGRPDATWYLVPKTALAPWLPNE